MNWSSCFILHPSAFILADSTPRQCQFRLLPKDTVEVVACFDQAGIGLHDLPVNVFGFAQMTGPMILQGHLQGFRNGRHNTLSRQP